MMKKAVACSSYLALLAYGQETVSAADTLTVKNVEDEVALQAALGDLQLSLAKFVDRSDTITEIDIDLINRVRDIVTSLKGRIETVINELQGLSGDLKDAAADIVEHLQNIIKALTSAELSQSASIIDKIQILKNLIEQIRQVITKLKDLLGLVSAEYDQNEDPSLEISIAILERFLSIAKEAYAKLTEFLGNLWSFKSVTVGHDDQLVSAQDTLWISVFDVQNTISVSDIQMIDNVREVIYSVRAQVEELLQKIANLPSTDADRYSGVLSKFKDLRDKLFGLTSADDGSVMGISDVVQRVKDIITIVREIFNFINELKNILNNASAEKDESVNMEIADTLEVSLVELFNSMENLLGRLPMSDISQTSNVSTTVGSPDLLLLRLFSDSPTSADLALVTGLKNLLTELKNRVVYVIGELQGIGKVGVDLAQDILQRFQNIWNGIRVFEETTRTSSVIETIEQIRVILYYVKEFMDFLLEIKDRFSRLVDTNSNDAESKLIVEYLLNQLLSKIFDSLKQLLSQLLTRPSNAADKLAELAVKDAFLPVVDDSFAVNPATKVNLNLDWLPFMGTYQKIITAIQDLKAFAEQFLVKFVDFRTVVQDVINRIKNILNLFSTIQDSGVGADLSAQNVLVEQAKSELKALLESIRELKSALQESGLKEQNNEFEQKLFKLIENVELSVNEVQISNSLDQQRLSLDSDHALDTIWIMGESLKANNNKRM